MYIPYLFTLMLYKQKDNKVVIVTNEVLHMPGYMKSMTDIKREVLMLPLKFGKLVIASISLSCFGLV